MTRKPRLDLDGFHHIVNRGVARVILLIYTSCYAFLAHPDPRLLVFSGLK